MTVWVRRGEVCAREHATTRNMQAKRDGGSHLSLRPNDDCVIGRASPHSNVYKQSSFRIDIDNIDVGIAGADTSRYRNVYKHHPREQHTHTLCV